MSLFTFLHDRPTVHLRGLQAAAFRDTATILAGTVVSDSGGGGATTWGTASTTPCRIDPLVVRPVSRSTAGQIDEQSTHIVTTPLGISVDLRYRVAVSGRGTFEVTGVRRRTGALSSVFEVKQVF